MTPLPPAPAGRRRTARTPARPVVLFSDEASSVARTTRIPEGVGATHPPLEYLTWRQPPARDDDGGVA